MQFELTKSDETMREVFLFLHFIGLAMSLGTSFAFMFLGMASARMEAKESLKFTLNTLALSKMGNIGLTLLVISGLYLMTPHWQSLSSSPVLIAKLALVLVLGALIGILSATAKKAKLGDAEMHLKKIAVLGRLSLLTAIVIVVLAVYYF